MADKVTSVGMLILTNVPNIGLVAVLQRRGEFNHERMGPQSWPGGCQVTAHGKVEIREELWRALDREITEELGHAIIEIFHAQNAASWANHGRPIYEEVSRFEDEAYLVIIYAMTLPPIFLRHIRLESSSGGLVLITENDVDKIQDITKFDIKSGVSDRQTIAMFPDSIEAVKKAFTIFK